MITKKKYGEIKHLLAKCHYLKNRPFNLFSLAYSKNGVICGCIVVSPTCRSLPVRPFEFSQRIVRISRLAVMPKYRKNGIASKMVKAIRKYGNFSHIECITKRLDLEPFFKKNGFKTMVYINRYGKRLYAYKKMPSKNGVSGEK